MLRALVTALLCLIATGSAQAFCPGDCDGDGRVAVHELIAAVAVGLDPAALAICADADVDADGAVRIGELTRALRLAFDGCGVDDLAFHGVLRTPDERFAALPDYPFAPHYAQIGALRVHYIDEGPRDADPILLLHGLPSWSYLYRHLIPPLVAAGHRVIAPDLVGFGRSDKPVERRAYTYQRMVDWTQRLVEILALQRVTLVLHDWGGLIGLRLAAADGARYARILVANTGLPTGDEPINPSLLVFRNVSQTLREFPVANFVQIGTRRTFSAAEHAAYDAPFPDETYKAGVRQLPILIPIDPHDPASPANRVARERLRQWDKPFLTAFSDSDELTRGGDALFQGEVPGAAGQAHVTIANAGHFLQEDAPEALAAAIAAFVAE